MQQPFYGRRIVFAALLLQAVAVGSTVSGYSVFLGSVEAEFSASRAQTVLGMSIFTAVSGLIGPILGRAVDLGPLRGIMTTGVLVLACGLAGFSLTSQLWQLGLLMALVSVGSAMFGMLPSNVLVANWFVRRRGTALGFAAMGSNLAGIGVPPLAAWLIERNGWRETLLFYAAAGLVIALPVVWGLVIRRPEDVGQKPDGVASPPASETPSLGISLREPNFWLIAFSMGLIFSAMITLLVNFVPYASSRGLDLKGAALLMSGMRVFSILGKVSFGALVDRIDVRVGLALSFGLQAATWLVLMSGPDYATLLVATAALGLSAGGVAPMHAALLGAAFGRAAFGRAMGAIGPIGMVFTLTVPPLAGWVYDVSGSYTVMFAPFLGVFALAAVLLFFVRLPR